MGCNISSLLTPCFEKTKQQRNSETISTIRKRMKAVKAKTVLL